VHRNLRFAVLGIALTMAISACGGSGDADSTADSAPSGAIELSAAGSAGSAVFQSKCAVCHRDDLSGGTGPALGLGSAASGKPIEDLRQKITEGGNGMPSWGGLLSAQEIDDVMTFLTEMQGR